MSDIVFAMQMHISILAVHIRPQYVKFFRVNCICVIPCSMCPEAVYLEQGQCGMTQVALSVPCEGSTVCLVHRLLVDSCVRLQGSAVINHAARDTPPCVHVPASLLGSILSFAPNFPSASPRGKSRT